MFSGSSAGFNRALEKATSQLLLEPDWDSTMQICDIIRQGDVQPKYAVAAMKRKISAENPHVEIYALQVLESCVKNCGSLIHEEIATKEFMEFLKDLLKIRPDTVKNKILELIQVWSHAFRNEPSYKVVQDTYNLMKLEGHTFPTLKEADAMFLAEKAPEWKEGDCCNRCRTKFGMVNRQHHCRNCGEVFCGKCSAKSSIIPKFGIEKEVRVCDSCFDILNKADAAKPTKKSDDELPAEYLASPLSKQQQVAPQKTEQEIQEEEELQLALALSQSEAETKQKERDRLRSNYGVYGGATTTASKTSSYTQPATVSAPMVDTEEMDPELARYLNRNYWQQKSEIKTTNVPTTTPSAPVVTTEQKATEGGKVVIEAYQNGENEDDEEQFLKALQSSLEIFVNRMRSNSQRGRSIATDSSVQSLFNVISNMHPQLMKYVGKQEDLRGNYEALQDKLAQLRDAREALDALREDHREKRRRELEEMERQRQIQMAHKLEIMRQKKHEYLEMQRQLALQRLQEQEREMQMRLEQQKHMTQIRQMQNYGYPQAQPGYGQMPMSGVPPQQTFSPVGSSDGSPVHQMQNMYGQQPMGHGQQPMGHSTPQMYNQPNTQPGYSQAGGQYQPQVTSQNGPQYQQGPYQQQPMSTQPSNLPGAYDGQAGYQTGGQYGQMPAATMSQGMPQQGGMPPSTASQGMPQTSMAQPQGMQPGMPQGGMPTSPIPPGMPQQGMPMNQGYQVPTSSNVDYNQAYNMQGMATALPQQQYSNQSQQYMGNQTGQYQQPPPQGQQQELPQGPPPGSNEAQLISFD